MAESETKSDKKLYFLNNALLNEKSVISSKIAVIESKMTENDKLNQDKLDSLQKSLVTE